MPKYIITYDAGWGDNTGIVDADNEDQAKQVAYAQALEEFESNHDHRCLGLATPELCEEHDLDFEEED